jgi:hypothetical protein
VSYRIVGICPASHSSNKAQHQKRSADGTCRSRILTEPEEHKFWLSVQFFGATCAVTLCQDTIPAPKSVCFGPENIASR